MVKVKQKKFLVTTRIVIVRDTPVVADTFEEALEKSRALQVADVVSWDGTANDYSIKVVGVCTPDSWDVKQ